MSEEQRQEIRMKLWCDVYVHNTPDLDSAIDSAIALRYANEAVEAFDERFPPVDPALFKIQRILEEELNR